MQKKFNFRLEALLRLKKFNEEKKKIELGQIVQKIKNIEDEMESFKKQMVIIWEQSESTVKKGTRAGVMSYFPYLLEGLKEEIVIRNKRREKLFIEQKTKINEVSKARGEVKVLLEMKRKDEWKFKQELNRKIDMELQDIISMNSHYKNSGDV